MKFYILTIEQIIKDGGYSEYANVEKVDSENTALSKYYKKLSDVSASIEKGVHTYMCIQILNSFGGVIKDDMVGIYQMPEENE